MRKIILFALMFAVFALMINYASASTVYDPPNDVYTWQWQEYGPRVDELYFKIFERERPPDPAQELYVDSLDGRWVDWIMVGDSPYLNATDYPNNYVESNTYCSYVGAFSFEDMAPLEPAEEIKGVTIDAHAWSDGPEIDCDIYISGSDFGWTWVGSIEASTTWSWVYPTYVDDITAYADTPEKIANLRVILHYWTPDGTSGNTVKVDALRLSIYTRPFEGGEIQGNAAAAAMQSGEIDVMPGWPGGGPGNYSIGLLEPKGFEVTRAPWSGHHFGIGFNMRRWPFQQDATGNAFRHATAHLVPKDSIVGMLNSYWGSGFVSRTDIYLPAAMHKWLNTEVDPHPYDPTEATMILTDAGYTFDTGLNNWRAPNGTELPVMRIFAPLYEQAPTSLTAAQMIVTEMHNIGLNSVVLQPMDFATYISMIRNDHDFEMYVAGWNWGDHPDALYVWFHSSQALPGLRNHAGIQNSTLDAQLEVVNSSTDLTAIMDAVSNAQTVLSEMLPRVPIYSGNVINIFNPNLDGIVNIYGYGAVNQWTRLNIHRHGIPLGGTLNWSIHGEPEFLSPASTRASSYAQAVFGGIYDELLAVNPETGELMPWIASNWNIKPWTAPGGIPGMNLTFWLRNDVCWQDNEQFTAEDVKFSLQYMQEHQLREFGGNLVEVVVPPENPYVAEVYLNTSNYWLLYDIVQAATLLPEHIWNGVTDPLSFQPWTQPHPTAPRLTQLIGTGPFYFVEYVPHEHVLFKSNPNYFQKIPTTSLEVVGSTGETVENVALTAAVEIPPGALTEDTTITIEQHPTSEYGGFLINQTDKIVSFGVCQFGPPNTTFETNVTITLTYNETAVDESQLEQLVVYSSDDGVTWYRITIESVDIMENTITFSVDHFSLFVILQPTIYGVVTDEYTLQPVEGVTVSVLETGASTATDARGRYSFVNLEDGSYTVEMTVPFGYLTHDAVTKFVEVTAATEVNFTLYQASWADATPPRTIGYWKNWDKHYTSELMQTFIVNVKNASGLFSEVTIENVDTYFKINRRSNMEDKAQAQLLASWFNVVSAQLGVDVQVDLTSIFGWETVIADDDGTLTVGELLTQIDNYYLADATLTRQQWETIKEILDALNNGCLFIT